MRGPWLGMAASKAMTDQPGAPSFAAGPSARPACRARPGGDDERKGCSWAATDPSRALRHAAMACAGQGVHPDLQVITRGRAWLLLGCYRSAWSPGSCCRALCRASMQSRAWKGHEGMGIAVPEATADQPGTQHHVAGSCAGPACRAGPGRGAAWGFMRARRWQRPEARLPPPAGPCTGCA